MPLEFVIAKKKKRVSKFDKQFIINIFVVLLYFAVNIISVTTLIFNKSEFLTNLIKPNFFIPTVASFIISLCVFVITSISVFLSLKFENNKFLLFLCSGISTLINLLVLISFFILHWLLACVLLIVSALLVSIFHFKQLGKTSVAKLLFLPYILWLIGNCVLLISLYLLN